ncbi:Ferric iron ABC transporter, ATP-binding protein [Rubellimicrobium mesophilum DSM 19309]|uniref:Ferric iron ABC transporter, ATP-binding protein n=1 Tax=Rubellimicrobium mesophilum DSM 19309 TaxID=442562 RepID=A0A017HTM4_9RHOB|nr:Ferric iron ABC transporter, ATP-binding protein [Rubellimicrobium mesophilum DSM 19309]
MFQSGMKIMEPRLRIEGLTRRFGGREVVRDVSLSIEAGQVSCLLGPSGCGKSTTLRLIAGVDWPDAGSIHVDGAPIVDGRARVPPEERGIGLMFQDFALFPHLTVAQNVAFGLPRKAAGRDERVRELLGRVGMTRHAEKHPHELSGGEQQRVALARALAPRPRIMLMDEPFSGLDDRLRDDIRDETLAVLKAEGTAVLLVTHEPTEAMRMADEILLMRDGRIVQAGAPYTIYNNPVDLPAAAFFSDLNVIRGGVEGAADGDALRTVSGTGRAGRDRGGHRDPAAAPRHRLRPGGAGATLHRHAWRGRARRRGAGTIHGVGEPGGVPDGLRRVDPQGARALGLPAEDGNAAVAHVPAGPLLRLPARGSAQGRLIVGQGPAGLVHEELRQDGNLLDQVDAEELEAGGGLVPAGDRPDAAPVVEAERAHDAARDRVGGQHQAELLAGADGGADRRHMAEPARGLGEGVGRESEGGAARGTVLGQHGLDLLRQSAGGVLELLIARFAHHGEAEVQGLELGEGEVQRGQGDRGGGGVAEAALARDGDAGGHQRVHVPVDRPLRDAQAPREVLGPVEAAVGQEAHEVEEAVVAGHRLSY